MQHIIHVLLSILTPTVLVLITFIGIRLLSYWYSFLLHWRRYRLRTKISTKQLREFSNIPFIKVQVTTRGSDGSTEVILRGIRNVLKLVEEDRQFYSRLISVEVVTESTRQAKLLTAAFAGTGLDVNVLVIPKDYETERNTLLKARGLHYIVDQRRKGWNSKPGKTFIVHFDEESVMLPSELRKLIAHLAKTDKRILEGPIYYPLEYLEASPLCRAMEANRPVGCFECRHVMEKGVPIHLHGSNMVIDEAIENEIGWDIGNIDGQPFISEDYVFGMNAFVAYGKEVFGWHGCVMLEQPPFSVKSAFKQRHRWIFGVLQGMVMIRRLEGFHSLPWTTKFNVIWGTRYRIASFGLGAIVGVLSYLLLPIFIPKVILSVTYEYPVPLAWPINLWLALVGIMWIGSIFIGAWYNVASAGLNKLQCIREIAKTIAIAPLAGLVESSAGLWAVTEWALGRREVFWKPTPKTKAADQQEDELMILMTANEQA